MNFLAFFGTAKFKLILVAVATIFITAAVWRFVSIVQKAERLEAMVQVQNESIKALQDTKTYHEGVINSMGMRITELRTLEKERNQNVVKKKDGSKKFTEVTKSEVKELPKESVDPYLKNRYNTVLDCVENTTKGLPDEC